ncbi:MAG: ABC-2 type transport system ATP-binding protein [Colwellia sp.]|jgi:ABC-2 type transport system ATP-binding protein
MSYTLVLFIYLWKIILQPIIQITDVNKVYGSGFQALNNINLAIKPAEIFALLGPNGAGKTTLISTICGIVDATSGQITVDGKDIVSDFRHTRGLIGLVPQELTTDAFETVWTTVSFSRGLFGKKPNPAFIEKTLKSLSLWDKKDNKLIELSGGMKRRVMIAKALSHQPAILFLDEPTAGVDVELRKDMWQLVRQLRNDGVTIILTTHYIEEAEEIADRIGVIKNGQLILVEDKVALMNQLGKKQLILDLKEPLTEIPSNMADFNLQIKNEGLQLIYSYDTTNEHTGISVLLQHLSAASIAFKDIKTDQSSLEDIFVSLVRETT